MFAILILCILFICFVFRAIIGEDDVISGGEDFPYIEGGAGANSTPLEVGAIQAAVKKKYRALAVPEKPPSFTEFCFPKKFELQNPQKFLGRFLDEDSRVGAILGFHSMGSGKTCAAITAAEIYVARQSSGRLSEGKQPAALRSAPAILAIMPASLVGNFYSELFGECTGGKYMPRDDSKVLREIDRRSPRAKEIIDAAKARIAKNYRIWSYNHFYTNHEEAASVPPALLILDEIHTINNPSGLFYPVILKFIEQNPNMKVLALTGTPVFDSYREIISLVRLLRVNPEKLLGAGEPVEFAQTLRQIIPGLVSYYSGAPQNTYPRPNLHYEITRMSAFQSKWYKLEVGNEFTKRGNIHSIDVANNFYIKSRSRANVVFPQGLCGTDGLPLLPLPNLETYSCKFARLLEHLKSKALGFIYTNFTSFAGIKTLEKCLQGAGWSNFLARGPGPRRYAIWSGDIPAKKREIIRDMFNSGANDSANLIQIIIGSPAMKEGVSLLRVRQIHVIEPYWNQSRMMQVIARGIRFCSHKMLPPDEREVDIYLYCAVIAESKCPKGRKNYMVKTPMESVDLYILQMAEQKQTINDAIVDVLINSAVDHDLGYGRNKPYNSLDSL